MQQRNPFFQSKDNQRLCFDGFTELNVLFSKKPMRGTHYCVTCI